MTPISPPQKENTKKDGLGEAGCPHREYDSASGQQEGMSQTWSCWVLASPGRPGVGVMVTGTHLCPGSGCISVAPVSGSLLLVRGQHLDSVSICVPPVPSTGHCMQHKLQCPEAQRVEGPTSFLLGPPSCAPGFQDKVPE